MRVDPAAVFQAIRGDGPAVFLDGASDVDGLGRFSYLASRPVGALYAWGRRLLHVDAAGRRRWQTGDPFDALDARLESLRGELEATGLADDGDDPRPFRAGAIGWFGYELGRVIERLPIPADDFSAVPDLALWFFPDVLAHDGDEGTYHGGAPHLRRAVEEATPFCSAKQPPPTVLASNFTRAEYVAAVAKIRERIYDGDLYQVNLSQRFEGALGEDAFDLYRRLRERTPAPLGAYLELGTRAVLSNSPELFLARTGSTVESRPIKGTRPRGETDDQDAQLVSELLASEKDAAELTMIIDLMRNDLGKVAVTGSVDPGPGKRLVTLPTVHHLVATVKAELQAGTAVADLLRATFPAGSITGCPKIRSMQRIAELEPCRRGVYTGAIGWVATNGDLRLNVAIRTLTATRGRLTFHAGGGIVADSDPEMEYEETLSKARAFFAALGCTGVAT